VRALLGANTPTNSLGAKPRFRRVCLYARQLYTLLWLAVLVSTFPCVARISIPSSNPPRRRRPRQRSRRLTIHSLRVRRVYLRRDLARTRARGATGAPTVRRTKASSMVRSNISPGLLGSKSACECMQEWRAGNEGPIALLTGGNGGKVIAEFDDFVVRGEIQVPRLRFSRENREKLRSG